MVPSNLQSIYHIKVQGRLNQKWAHWLNGSAVQIMNADDTTISVSVPDQAALRGILNKLWDLNLTLISVTRQVDGYNTGEYDEY